MIYDGNWIPQSDNEYQQRLLAATMLMVKAAGGKIIITQALMQDEALHGQGTMLQQERDHEGNITLTVTNSRNPNGVKNHESKTSQP